MTQFVAWVLFPVVLALLSLGCGALLEAAAGVRFRPGLIMPAGLGVIVVVAEIITKSSALAHLSTPVIIVLALLGGILRRPWGEPPWPRPWMVLAGFGVYVAYLAPVILSGEATFTGFIKLDDTSTWLAMTDWVMSHGHSIAGLPLSTFEATLFYNLAGTEPVGSMLPWGVAHQIVGQDLAWLFQPYLAFLGAMIALAGWSMVRPLIRSKALCALVVFIAAQASLIYGYSLWGGVKEVATCWALALFAASTAPVFDYEARIRSFLPLAVAVLVMLGALGTGGIVWLPVALLAVGLAALRIWVRARARPQLALLGVVAVGVIVGLILSANSFLAANGVLTGATVLGNLAHPLSGFQIFGIWPATDFRVDPPRAAGLTYFLIALLIVAIGFTLVWAWRRGAWAALLYLGSAVVGAVLVSAKGGPWVVGKALAIASPALLFLGLAGLAALIAEPAGALDWETSRLSHLVTARRAVGALIAGAISLAVLWGNALSYGHVTLGPYGQMSELSYIGQHFAGRGPTMINENEPYAGRHFLRQMAPEEPSDLRTRADTLRTGGELQEGNYADLDQFTIPTLFAYRTIVTRTSPVASRPPAAYRLLWTGTWYQVWEKTPARTRRPVIDSLPLGDQYNPAAVPGCPQVAKLAHEAGPRGLLAAVARFAPTGITIPSQLPAGSTREAFQVATPGEYVIWLGGSIVGHLVTWVDRKQIGSAHETLNEPGGYTPLGRIRLGRGIHTLILSYSGTSLAPGSAGPGNANDPFLDGPVEISPPPGQEPVTYVSPSRYRTLCGQPWDWVEALGPNPAGA